MQLTQIQFDRQQEHLAKVSRTFALTIPLLPTELIDYISNAYLLCRIADTIEDDPKALVKQKIAWLNSFATFCKNEFSDDMQLLSLHKTAIELVETSAKPCEFDLMQDMLGVISRTRTFPKRIKQILANGVCILSFGMAKSLQGHEIKNLDDVDSYCYYVAGIVGEILALLFYEQDKTIDKQKLLNLSVSFGEGLQLTNILKDRYEDSLRNVSFLPIEKDDAKASLEYIEICQGHLQDAINFITSVPRKNTGIRIFCLLNVLMATATLKRIKTVDICGLQKVKISRNQVKFLYIWSRLIAKSNLLVKLTFNVLGLGVKKIKRDPIELRNKVSCWELK